MATLIAGFHGGFLSVSLQDRHPRALSWGDKEDS